MTTAEIEIPAESPVCDWDSPPNPTFDQWTTVNLAEVFPGVAWPFDATWYHRWQTGCFRGMLSRLGVADLIPLYEWPVPNFLGFWGGRCAANVAFTAAIASTWQVSDGSSAVEQFFTADQPGSYRAKAARDLLRGRRTRTRFLQILSHIPQAAGADRRRAKELATDVATMSMAGLPDRSVRTWLERVETLAKHTFFHHCVTSLGAGEFSSLLNDHLAASIPDLPADAVLSLTSGLGEVESARPMQALWHLSRWVRERPALQRAIPEMAVEDLLERIEGGQSEDWRQLGSLFGKFLEAYGYRGQTEWMLALPDWSEDPRFPLNSLRNMVEAPDDAGPDRLHAAAAAQRCAAERRYRGQLPVAKQDRFDTLLARAQHLVRLREYTKSNCIRGVRPGRPLVLELGRRLASRGFLCEPGDVFYLFAHEVDDAVAGSLAPAETKEAVERRRAQKQALEAYTLPDNFTGTPEILRRESAVSTNGALLSGLGVSPGVASGRARVVTSLDDALEVTMEPGEVLVAPFTDAPWTPLFLLASAVVVETGGLLSHAATVAREFGIPAVVMVKDATRLIQTGQALTVDGGAGEVRLAV